MHIRVAAVALLVCMSAGVVVAQEFSSDAFRVIAPVIEPGGYSTSDSFGLQSIIAEFGVGTSTASSYGLNPGFLYFPFVTSPTVSATASSTEVALSWTTSEGFLGWTVAGYDVGQSTSSGGPYTYTSLGNVTSSTRTGLTNGTAYYFVIVVKDSLGNQIATSTQVSATPAASGSGGSSSSSGSSGGGGGGGGGGGSVTVSGSSVFFSGRAYPLSTVKLLKDGQIAVSTIAGPDARFDISLSGLSAGSYLFSLHGEDKDGRRSDPFTFPIELGSNASTKVGGVFLTPTIDSDKSAVKKGDNITVFGQTVPSADVVVNVNSENNLFLTTQSDEDGVYLRTFDTSPLEYGDHSARSKSNVDGLVSDFGHLVNFIVGTENVARAETRKRLVGDLNDDNRVNIVDFSIAAYWHKRANPPQATDLNSDGRVDIIDFSIMAYYWTG